MTQTRFKRNEKKYVLTSTKYAVLQPIVDAHMARDRHFRSSIQNIYFDTEHDELIVASLDELDYKYKVRARSYGTNISGNVFFEIKSKLRGTVYKRRVMLTHDEYGTYLRTGQYPDSQVMREVDRLFREKSLTPKAFVAYDRSSYTATDDSDLRITFDAHLRSRTHDLDLEKSDTCERYFSDDTCVMEIKSTSGLPQWLRDSLTSQHIYPSSFSKYGKIYQRNIQKELSYA